MRRRSRDDCAGAPRVAWRLAMVLLVLVETSCQNTEIESTTPMPTEDATGGVAGLKVDTTPPSTHYCCRHAARSLF